MADNFNHNLSDDLMPPIAPPSFATGGTNQAKQDVSKQTRSAFVPKPQREESANRQPQANPLPPQANFRNRDNNNFRPRPGGMSFGEKNGSRGEVFKTTEEQKVEEEKLRRMIANEHLGSLELLREIGKRFDGRLTKDQITILVGEVQKREYERHKKMIADRNLSARFLLESLAQAEITPSQRKELIEVLQNREEVSIREKIDNPMVKANYLLELIATGELSENQRKDLLGAVQQREEELVRSYV